MSIAIDKRSSLASSSSIVTKREWSSKLGEVPAAQQHPSISTRYIPCNRKKTTPRILAKELASKV